MRYMHDEALRVLPRVLDAAGIERAILIGHSDGGSIAAIHAGGAHDPRIAGIVLIAAHFFVEDLNLQSIARIRTEYETTDLRDRLARYHANVDNAFRGWNDAWLDPRFRDFDITGYLPDITVPVLALQGVDDPYGTEAQLEALERWVKTPLETRLIPAARQRRIWKRSRRRSPRSRPSSEPQSRNTGHDRFPDRPVPLPPLETVVRRAGGDPDHGRRSVRAAARRLRTQTQLLRPRGRHRVGRRGHPVALRASRGRRRHLRLRQRRVFCAGANIRMLAKASHGHKVNFCKFTNETRLAIEDACDNSGQHYVAAIGGGAAGGGYELALTADHLMLIDDRRSAVSLPELPLLAVLPAPAA